MQRRTVIASIGAIVGTSVGAAAYTSATVTRDASFTVTADSNALIGLEGGENFEEISTVDGGETFNIAITGLNRGSSFTYGDSSDLSSAYAFSITNNDSATQEIKINYTGAGVKFHLYEPGTDSDWTAPTALDPGSVSNDTKVDWTAEENDEIRVVLEIDTSQIESDASELSGELEFSV